VTRYVALLRGINVGRNKKVAMADLRELLAGLGYTAVRTHLRSGNAVFTSPERAPEALAREIEEAITGKLGLDVRCVVVDRDELARVIEGNPFDTAEPARLLVTFLSGPLDHGAFAGIDSAQFAPEAFHLGIREAYFWCANGISDSKMLPAFPDKGYGVTATARNWNTVTKLLTLADAED
jgi:uncharacterized protein (DUF1697 family)